MSFRSTWPAGLGLAALLLATPACESPPQPPPVKFENTVRGKVTYQGKPLPFGLVLFYTHGAGFDPGSRTFVPASSAVIGEDGSYEVTNAPEGQVMVCVAADPDKDLRAYLRPTAPGAQGPGGPGEPPGPDQPPMPDGAPEGPEGPPPPPLPGAEKLTDKQKAVLKKAHAKYCVVGEFRLAYLVHKGEQTIDIELK